MYPTLIELCGLPPKKDIDGHSLGPLLEDPNRDWDFPVLTTYGHNNHAIRSGEFRYIHLNGGVRELYHTAQDPHEWHNLANTRDYEKMLDSLGAWLPTENVEPVPNWKGK